MLIIYSEAKNEGNLEREIASTASLNIYWPVQIKIRHC